MAAGRMAFFRNKPYKGIIAGKTKRNRITQKAPFYFEANIFDKKNLFIKNIKQKR